jgi:hypothetical protein
LQVYQSNGAKNTLKAQARKLKEQITSLGAVIAENRQSMTVHQGTTILLSRYEELLDSAARMLEVIATAKLVTLRNPATPPWLPQSTRSVLGN